MPRIRTTKPEYWSSEQIMCMSRDARLCFIGLWNFCDDAGTHPASPKTLKAVVFPGDDDVDVAALVGEMTNQGLIVEYEAAGKRYWHVTGWHHQKIDRPNYKHPLPDGTTPKAETKYEGIRRIFDDYSTNVRRALAPGREGSLRDRSLEESKGEESKGEESKGEEREERDLNHPPPPEGEISLSKPVYAASGNKTGQHGGARKVHLSITADDGTCYEIDREVLRELSLRYRHVNVFSELGTLAEALKRNPEAKARKETITELVEHTLRRLEEHYR